MVYPNFCEEKKLWRRGYTCVAGLDEVGRGPLAGPVVACAVVITTAKLKIKNKKRKMTIKNLKLLNGVKDSKKISQRAREKFYKILTAHPAIEWGLGRVSEKVIDKINIFEATKLAMIKAVENLITKNQRPKTKAANQKLKIKPDYLILDGNFKINFPVVQKAIVKADEKVFSCAAASIIAKVFRDRLMEKYDKKYPVYGFRKHKGYPTKEHFEKLRKYKPCPIHRRSFGPVARCE